MPIRIYDSLTKKKVDFFPLETGKVKMYSCGVTVYDDCHIGHARSLYIFDVITRYLKYRNYEVTFIRNITDIDDKIINKAKELGITTSEVAQKYIESYKRDLKSLGIDQTNPEPKATENIPEMIEHIRALIERGFAYEVEGDVYFSVRQFKDYGRLSGQSIEQMLEAVRIEKDPKKRDPLDFALWKKSKEGEHNWESPWGKGRPGWHIECSVMSSKFLKTQTLDIHAGGRDLIFPHHENEIAQSEAITGKPFAKYWLHHGLLTINGQKMAKSLGNFVTIKDFMNKYNNADILKLFFLSSHYSSPIDFSEERIQEAKKELERISNINIIAKVPSDNLETHRFNEIESKKNKFIEVMDDDFNTPQALAVIFGLVNFANKNIENSEFSNSVNKTVKELLNVLGISLRINVNIKIVESLKIKAAILNPHVEMGISEKEIEEKVLQRDKARKNKNFEEADKIRKELEKKGIILEDTKDGVFWRKL
ncbi:MAG: cysteine--tRNA ligase [Candidatus Omnitrophota bacterium]|nr:cysteine--tRNA ligase [Candidatus Omnitrophota bacterium]